MAYPRTDWLAAAHRWVQRQQPAPADPAAAPEQEPPLGYEAAHPQAHPQGQWALWDERLSHEATAPGVRS